MSHILLLDTQPATFDIPSATVETRSPDEATLEDLKQTNLVLVDFKIDDWVSANDLQIPLVARPVDGLAVAHAIRRRLHKEGDLKPPAVALITNEYDLAAKPLPVETLPHILARLNGIEWVFKKGESGDKILALAQACSDSLYQVATAESEEARLSALCIYLGITTEQDADQILDELRYCHPPLHQLIKWEDGLLVLRWLLQRILPYPTMLVGDSYLAKRAQCQIEPMMLALDREFPEALTGMRYRGACAEMFDRRYWRTFVEVYLSQVLQDKVDDPSAVRHHLQEILQTELAVCEPSVEGIGVDKAYGRTLVTIADAREVSVDDWPPFAASAVA